MQIPMIMDGVLSFRIRKRHLRSVATAIVAGFLLYVAWTFFAGPRPHVPNEFNAARLQGALIAQEIVDVVSESNDRLYLISTYDVGGDYRAALDLSARALEENKAVADSAVSLSKQLEVMLRNLEQVYPPEAQTKAQGAILAEVQLINKLISYSQLLSQLLEELRLKLKAHLNGVASPGIEIQTRVDEINREIRNINALNQEFIESMKEFDRYFSK